MLSRGRRDLVLYVVALLLACACVAVGVLVVDEHADRDEAAATARRGERYGEVIAAAEATAVAMVNIDGGDPQASFDAVAATATGSFLEEWQAGSEALIGLVGDADARMTGTVASSAVSTLDSDSASVIVATTGDVANTATGGEKVLRQFRFLIRLVLDDGAWRANELEFVA